VASFRRVPFTEAGALTVLVHPEYSMHLSGIGVLVMVIATAPLGAFVRLVSSDRVGRRFSYNKFPDRNSCGYSTAKQTAPTTALPARHAGWSTFRC
jgi:hypothetical protein